MHDGEDDHQRTAPGMPAREPVAADATLQPRGSRHQDQHDGCAVPRGHAGEVSHQGAFDPYGQPSSEQALKYH